MKAWRGTLVAIAMMVLLVVAPMLAQKQPSKPDVAARVHALPGTYTVLVLALTNEFKDFTATPNDADGWTIEFSKTGSGPEGTDYKAVMKKGKLSAFYVIRDITKIRGNSVVNSLEVSIPADQPYFMKE